MNVFFHIRVYHGAGCLWLISEGISRNWALIYIFHSLNTSSLTLFYSLAHFPMLRTSNKHIMARLTRTFPVFTCILLVSDLEGRYSYYPHVSTEEKRLKIKGWMSDSVFKTTLSPAHHSLQSPVSHRGTSDFET